ncbi:glutamate--cysteine ligase [Corynebacterium yudongzhengii]|uniref:Putative glutamate--cysteine ligase 2 n=1 Tax=Corynebacterium yudongzhengii TaxID=2080740 RepID=A0A2U1T5T7_9CORY|nr:glutamate--cysteine ligase [Corynebacterium yudongzhengii]AWB82667.1 glutamate--cysteine ligase [Corynebacterium yudongzhengii]PWC01367.1 glutamate--cysteine ligase [Corynebacterium yudongzhengii]
MAQSFKRSPKPTLGVEWEVGVIDPVTRDLVPRAVELIDLVNDRHSEIHFEREFLQNTVELVTGIHDSVPSAVAELHDDLEALRVGANELGLKLWASGSHPFSDFRKQPVSAKMTYAEIINRTQYWGQQMLIWGIHAHVGVSHEDRVWPIINALMTKYPHLLAPSASSPGWDGIDTGYASNRTMLYQQLPTAGMPYQFGSWQEWLNFEHDQATSGVTNHTGSMHFDIRPAAKWGTIEIRVSDATSNLRELSALVALAHCLVVYYDRKIDRGEDLPTLQPWHVAENKWRAARYGMEALVITSRDTEERWITQELDELIDELMPVAHDLDCAPELALIPEISERAAGYSRQRRLFQLEGDWKPVIDKTAAEMWELRPER